MRPSDHQLALLASVWRSRPSNAPSYSRSSLPLFTPGTSSQNHLGARWSSWWFPRRLFAWELHWGSLLLLGLVPMPSPSAASSMHVSSWCTGSATFLFTAEFLPIVTRRSSFLDSSCTLSDASTIRWLYLSILVSHHSRFHSSPARFRVTVYSLTPVRCLTSKANWSESVSDDILRFNARTAPFLISLWHAGDKRYFPWCRGQYHLWSHFKSCPSWSWCPWNASDAQALFPVPPGCINSLPARIFHTQDPHWSSDVHLPWIVVDSGHTPSPHRTFALLLPTVVGLRYHAH